MIPTQYVNTAEYHTRKIKKISGSARLSVKTDGGIGRGVRMANICIRNVKITLMARFKYE